MLQELAQHTYLYIMSAEMLLWRFFKINPFEMLANMPMLDLDAYLKRLQYEEEQERKNRRDSDIMKCLHGISDYLNVMFYKK